MYYELYIDVLFLVNFMMDYILLLLVRKILKCSATHGNICLGALTGSVLTCLVVVMPIPYAFVKFILFHAVVNAAMIKAGLRIRWNRTFVKAMILLYISGFLVGGVFEYLNQYVKAGSLFFAIAVACYYISSGILSFLTAVFHIGEYRYKVTLYWKSREYTVFAMLDTGNRLRDEVTGKPVSIIGPKEAGALFGGKMPEGMRYIAYHTIGRKKGIMPVVTLDRLRIYGEEEQWVEKPLVGISEEDISAGKEYGMILNPDI